MAKEDAWGKGYKESQARYMDELRREREAAETRRQHELQALRAAAKALRGGKG